MSEYQTADKCMSACEKAQEQWKTKQILLIHISLYTFHASCRYYCAAVIFNIDWQNSHWRYVLEETNINSADDDGFPDVSSSSSHRDHGTTLTRLLANAAKVFFPVGEKRVRPSRGLIHYRANVIITVSSERALGASPWARTAIYLPSAVCNTLKSAFQLAKRGRIMT